MGRSVKVGDLVTIYFIDHAVGGSTLVDKTGLLIQIFGHKARVLVENKLESWDISDLIKMREYKNAAL